VKATSPGGPWLTLVVRSGSFPEADVDLGREVLTTVDADLSSMAESLELTPFDRGAEVALDAMTAAVPVVGAIIAAVARQLLPRDSVIYLVDFAREVARRVERLDEGKVDWEFLASPAFREDVEQAFEAQAALRQRRKREHFLAALANSATVDRPADDDRKRMLDALVRLRESHLRLLAAIVTAGDNPGPGSTTEYLQGRLGVALGQEALTLDWQDLATEGLVSNWPSGITQTPKWQLIASALTSRGQRFATFIEAAGNP